MPVVVGGGRHGAGAAAAASPSRRSGRSPRPGRRTSRGRGRPGAAEAEVGEAEDALVELAAPDLRRSTGREASGLAADEVGRLVEPEVEVALADRLPVLLGEDARRDLGREGLLERGADVEREDPEQPHPRVQVRVLELHQVDGRVLEQPVQRLLDHDRRVLRLRRVEHVRPELRVRLDRVDRRRELLGVGVDVARCSRRSR